MKRSRLTVSILCLLLLCGVADAQLRNQNRIKKWSVKDGLSQGVVNSIVQDDQSIMWLATEDGLNRFDGYAFKIFRYNPEDQTTIPDNFIQHLFKDSEGNLWVSSRKGLLQFNPYQETFALHRYQATGDSSLMLNDVSHITEGTKKNLWIAWYGNGFASFTKKSHSFIPYTPKNLPGLKGEKIVTLLEDKFGLLWVGSQDGGINVFHVSDGTVTKAAEGISQLAEHASKNIHCFVEDKAGNVWIGTSSGLMLYKRRENRFFTFEDKRFAIAGLSIFSLFEDSDDNLWIGTQGAGLFQLDLRQFNTRPLSDFIFSRIKNLNDLDISRRTILSIYEDKHKNLWIGTFGDGVYLISSAKQKFIKIQKPLYDNTAVSYIPYYGMCYDKEGALWLGTDGHGILKSDINGNTIRHYTSESTKGGLKDHAVLSALRDSKNDLWFGTYSQGIFKYVKDKDNFVQYRYDEAKGYKRGAMDVRVLFEDSRNNVWVGTNRGGLCIVDDSRKIYSNPPHFRDNFLTGDVRAIAEDKDGNLWIGFYGDGLYSYVPSTKKIQRHFFRTDEPLLKSDIVFAVKADRLGRIWIGTGGSGLCMYDPKENKFRRFTESDGLSNNTIYAILFDNNENVWVTTNAGISKFDQNKRRFDNYDVSDGLQEGQFNPGSAMFNETGGFMCMGGSYGLNILYPDQLTSPLPKSKILISGFSLFNRPVKVNDSSYKTPILRENISRTKEIVLAHDQNVFTFDFVGLNYSYPEKNRYAYKLEGLDAEWNYVGEQRTATYRYLDPATYTFKVKVSNVENGWDDEFASVKIVIEPPFWKTPYAYTLYVAGIGVLIWLGIAFRKKQINLRKRLKIEKNQRKHERELVRQKLSFFTEVSHEFKTPLTLMIGPLEEMLSTETGLTPMGRKLKMVYRNAHKLLNLINKLLDYRKLESGHVMLKIREDNIVDFVQEIFLTFKELANHKNIKLNFQSEEPSLMLWFDSEKLEMVLNNIISNSFKYIGKGDEITIMVCRQISDRFPQGRAVIKIRDNGIGIPKKHLGNVFDWFHKGDTSGTMSSGIGLALAKRLVHLHKGEIFVESMEGSATIFSIKLPMGKDHFKAGEYVIQDTKTATDEFHLEKENEHGFEPELDHHSKKGFKSLLLIEDDEEILQFLREYFERDYKILEAANGREGLETAYLHHPDLIISDIMMPEMDGIDFCKEVKNNIKTSHVPVILLTAKTSLTHHKEGIQTGADAYITKPFSPEILAMTVQNLILSRENLKKYYRNLFTQESPGPQPKEPASIDEKFLQSIYNLLKLNLDKPDFNVNELCDVLNMSRSLVYKKVKMLTGLSPVEYIRSLRMQEAAKLLKTRQYKVFEVVYMVGFSDVKYFRQCFTKEFGFSPSEFIKQTEEARD